MKVISDLYPCLSKVLEDFVVAWMIHDIRNRIAPNQFGCLKGTSTSFCLLDMMHTWLSHLDSPNKHLRLSFLDFSKAFDRISHNVLIKKLVDLGVRWCLIPWIISFLSDRRQRVKIGEAFLDWLPVNAGVPQGTKLGPILFLIMINDLSIPTPETNLWKFEDDVSISECLTKNGGASIQSTLDTVSSWASMNLMKLNAKKCKELRVCFFKATPQLPPSRIDGQVLETVHSHKVLGLVIQDNLKWNENTCMIVSMASKRLHIICVLRRGGVSAADLLVIYVALVRSILEYCCVVWHNALPAYLSSEIERVQMRALRIIYPRASYQEALQRAKITSLEDRRNELCMRAFDKITKGGPLSKHLTPIRSIAHDYSLRNSNSWTSFKCKTERFRRSFFPSTVLMANATSFKN